MSVTRLGLRATANSSGPPPLCGHARERDPERRLGLRSKSDLSGRPPDRGGRRADAHAARGRAAVDDDPRDLARGAQREVDRSAQRRAQRRRAGARAGELAARANLAERPAARSAVYVLPSFTAPTPAGRHGDAHAGPQATARRDGQVERSAYRPTSGAVEEPQALGALREAQRVPLLPKNVRRQCSRRADTTAWRDRRSLRPRRGGARETALEVETPCAACEPVPATPQLCSVAPVATVVAAPIATHVSTGHERG